MLFVEDMIHYVYNRNTTTSFNWNPSKMPKQPQRSYSFLVCKDRYCATAQLPFGQPIHSERIRLPCFPCQTHTSFACPRTKATRLNRQCLPYRSHCGEIFWSLLLRMLRFVLNSLVFSVIRFAGY